MQTLLSRLKSLHDQSLGDNDQSTQDDGGTGKKVLLNNFINSEDVYTSDDKQLQNGLSILSTDTISGHKGSKTAEDSLAIDAVMATNRTQSRTRNRSSTSSPRTSTKNSRNRGSRVSLNSVSLSEKEDLDISGMNSDDELGSSHGPQIISPAQAWAAFENTVKTIDNSSADIFIKKPKPNFVSSGTFQKVMTDMYGNTEYGNTKGYTLLKQKLNGMAKATNIASRMFASAAAKGQEDREQENNVNTEEESDTTNEVLPPVDDVDGPEKVTKVFAQRGWKMLKRQVNETVMETKTQATKMNWTMIQHTVKQMSNVERTRHDLYERYGIIPTVQEDGSVKCENRMLSERARAQLNARTNLDGNENKRPMSYQPPPTHLRSQSTHSGFYKKQRNSAKLPNIGGPKRRPVTAIR